VGVELKCVEKLLTYLRLTPLQVGLLINFNVARLATGIKRRVNNYKDSASPRLRGDPSS